MTRLPLPQALSDPAFIACLRESLATPEFLEQFDRLYGSNLATRSSPIEAMSDNAAGKIDDDMRGFVAFIHDAVYLRIPGDAIADLRAHPEGERN